MLGLLFSSLNQFIVGTAMPRIVTDLGGLEQYAWVTTAYMLTTTASVPIFGKLSDIYGRKWFFIGGVALFMVASILCGASQSMLQLILFRALQGIGGGILIANAFAIIGDLFPPSERGKWQGLLSAVFGISSIIGPLLGGWLTDGPGWRWVFYINLPVGVIAIAVLFYGLPHIRHDREANIDWLGAAAIVTGIVPLLLAFSWAGSEYDWASVQIIGLLCLAVAGIVAFLFAEARAKDPIIPLSLFSHRTYAVSVASSAMLGAGMFGAILYIPLFMQGVVGVSATNSGLALTPLMLGMVFSSILGGQVISRIGRYKWAVVLGLFSMLTGLYLLSRMGVDTTIPIAVRNMVITGLGIGLVMPTITLAVQNAFPFRLLGVTTASLQFFRQIGGTIGIALMGSFLNAQLASNILRDIPAETLEQVPPDVLDRVDAQALANPEAQAELEATLAGIPNSEAVFTTLLDAMRVSLAAAIQDVFMLAALVALIAAIIGLFLPEVPLRKTNDDADIEPAGQPASETRGETPPAKRRAAPVTQGPSAAND